jgi:hypothetical protein
MQAGPQEVDRRREQGGVDLDHRGQLGHWAVDCDEIPGGIKYDRGVGLVCCKDPIERIAHGREFWSSEGPFGEGRSVAGREEELVSLPEWNVKLLGDRQEHLAAGLRAPGLDEAQMAR